ncbi:uncharacterized protein STEHIDRAFT_167931 [Stereum hirsutum FP-91666 SS1]|uniref:uncharacterized protein n=1 Tax=Stereum hirsutum (strain FP-91666) TaxID=721885 RepID=UPI000440E266|nr:uncharacterized protein STEHIDRAFT_167931 [Stereum hirsutum FP-91666 SS1]EIM87067.1 hypothetical protein STEHIDRAFT_167931 [Stereum hirsutum FP-91666 SS1]
MVSSTGSSSNEHRHRASADNLLNHDLPSSTPSAIAVVAAGHLEHRVTVPLGPRANAVTVAITVVSQVFNQVYLVALVLLAQQLSLRKTLHRRQTLTEVHDKHTAWSGFGAALVTVLNQRKLPTAVWGVFAIAGYLLSILVLHITVPATFSLATFNESFPGTVTLTSNIPDIGPTGSNYLDLEDASAVLPMLKTLSHTNTTIGLQGNVIFASVTDARAAHIDGPLPIFQEFEVNATVFHVNCSLLPGATQNGTGSFNEWNITTPVPDGSTSPTVPMRLLYPYGIRFLPVAAGVQSVLIGQSMMLYASLNITDDQGHNGTHLELDPPMAFSDGHDYLWLPQTWQPTITTCNMYTEIRNVILDPSSRNITSDSIPDRTPQTTWREWQAPSETNDTLISSWSSIANVHSMSTVQATTCNVPWFSYPDPASETCQYSDFLTVTERYLNSALGVGPPRSFFVNSEDRLSSISLAELEMALENLTAAIYWSAANTIPSNGASVSFLTSTTSEMRGVLLYNPNDQLNVNVLPLLLGLVSSLALLVLLVLIVRRPDHSKIDPNLSMVGFLQLIWLLGRGSEAQDQVIAVKSPTTDNLRKAALVEIHFESLPRGGDDDEVGEWDKEKNTRKDNNSGGRNREDDESYSLYDGHGEH